ncbi:MAG TPA: hypothetical protein VL485_22360, partial [Ktedonobacteraceae bacterium]|nr:hypothetical protein [Ktedonobacteraceae bacterium]
IPYSSLLVRDRVDDENLRPESNPVADKQRRIRINRRMAETFKRAGGAVDRHKARSLPVVFCGSSRLWQGGADGPNPQCHVDRWFPLFT